MSTLDTREGGDRGCGHLNLSASIPYAWRHVERPPRNRPLGRLDARMLPDQRRDMRHILVRASVPAPSASFLPPRWHRLRKVAPRRCRRPQTPVPVSRETTSPGRTTSTCGQTQRPVAGRGDQGKRIAHRHRRAAARARGRLRRHRATSSSIAPDLDEGYRHGHRVSWTAVQSASNRREGRRRRRSPST